MGYLWVISRVFFRLDNKGAALPNSITIDIINNDKEVIDIDDLLTDEELDEFRITVTPLLDDYFKKEKNICIEYGDFWEQLAKEHGWDSYYVNNGAPGGRLEIIKEFKTDNQTDSLVMFSPSDKVVSVFKLNNRFVNMNEFYKHYGLFDVEEYITILTDKGIEFNPFSKHDIHEIQEFYNKIMYLWTE